MNAYDRTHWEELVRTIIERIGLEEFVEVYKTVLMDKMMDENMQISAPKEERPHDPV